MCVCSHCQHCAYKNGLCTICGKTVTDTSMYASGQLWDGSEELVNKIIKEVQDEQEEIKKYGHVKSKKRARAVRAAQPCSAALPCVCVPPPCPVCAPLPCLVCAPPPFALSPSPPGPPPFAHQSMQSRGDRLGVRIDGGGERDVEQRGCAHGRAQAAAAVRATIFHLAIIGYHQCEWPFTSPQQSVLWLLLLLAQAEEPEDEDGLPPKLKSTGKMTHAKAAASKVRRCPSPVCSHRLRGSDTTSRLVCSQPIESAGGGGASAVDMAVESTVQISVTFGAEGPLGIRWPGHGKGPFLSLDPAPLSFSLTPPPCPFVAFP